MFVWNRKFLNQITHREYEARLQRYAERIWTCKSTGSSQLTHKEAWEEEQEVTELLVLYPKVSMCMFPAWSNLCEVTDLCLVAAAARMQLTQIL